MAGGVSVHAVDLTRGEVAAGLALELRDRASRVIAAGRITATGAADCAGALALPLIPGPHSLHFHVADYFRARGDALPEVPFLDIVRFDFEVAAAEDHLHLPFKFSAWGYSLFRGN